MNTSEMREAARKLYDKAEIERTELTRIELTIEEEPNLDIASVMVDNWNAAKARSDDYVRQADALMKQADYIEYTESN